jgi:hypothetical protein
MSQICSYPFVLSDLLGSLDLDPTDRIKRREEAHRGARVSSRSPATLARWLISGGLLWFLGDGVSTTVCRRS